MAPLDDTTPENRFDSFDVHLTSYKKVSDQGIDVAVVIPKELKAGKYPVMVKFHGGGLITGDCLYPDWMAAFLVPFMHRNASITIMPNYRLIPEHTGVDIYSDIQDFWNWFRDGELSNFITSKWPDVELDFDHVLVAGDSAGGYMALMSAMTQQKETIKAVLAQYPMTNYLRREEVGDFFGSPPPGPEIVDEHLKSVKKGRVVSSAPPPARLELSFGISAYGRYLEFFGDDNKLWPINRIEDVAWMPPTWIIHGDHDTAVDIEDSRAFAKKWDEKKLESELRMDIREGQEHGFDIGMKEDDEKWLKDGLAWIEAKWLA